MRRFPLSSPADLPAARAAVRAALDEHGVVAIPTESSYGLAAAPADAEGVARVFAAKGRRPDKALPLVAASLAQVEAIAILDPTWRERLAAVWPAALSVVLPARAGTGLGATVAIRVPAHPLLRGVLHASGPLTATSANRSGGAPTLSPEAVMGVFGGAVALLLDGGELPGGPPSTLIDVSGSAPVLLRAGACAVPDGWAVRGG